MKKVLLVIPSLLQGGGQKFVLDLANELDKTQYKVKILIYYNALANAFKDQISKLKEVEIITLNKKLGLDFSFFKKLKQVVKAYEPDIIHSHLNTLLYLLPTFKKRQVKLHTMHSIASKEAHGIQKFISKIAFKLYKVQPVAISDAVAMSIKNYYKIKDVPIVYNGVVCKNYQGEKIEHFGINIITVGTLYEVKNHKYLIDCFYVLASKYDDLSLTIVGDGVLREELQNQVIQLGISNKVFFVGETSNVKNYLLKADIFASSSLYEGLPLSMLEAMAAGLPIVANNVGGISDIVNNGYLVPYGEKDKYIAALDKLISNFEERNFFGKNGKKLSIDYDEVKTVKAYERLYQK